MSYDKSLYSFAFNINLRLYTTVTQMIYVAQFFGQLLPGSKICQWAWLLIVWAISVPVMQIPTFHASRWAGAYTRPLFGST
jgi:hypothetical protein